MGWLVIHKHILRFLALIILSTTVNAYADEKLVFAVDLIRHGDRTPIKEIPKSPAQWKNGLGELTEVGVQQEKKLGEELRVKYITQSHLLPETYDPSSLFVRSTDFERTIKSANSLLLGLYPLDKRAGVNQVIPIYVVTKKEDKTLLAKPDTHFFTVIKNYFSARHVWNEKTIKLQDKLKYWSETTGLPLNNFHELDVLGDNLYIRKINHLPLPAGISSNDADQIISLSRSAMIDELKQKNETYPMGHEFLKTVVNYLELVQQHKTSLKYVLFSAHDSSIMSVMNTLQSPLGDIPRYASHLNFSLMENANQYYVKVSFNNKPVYIPACGGSICTLSELNNLKD